MQGGKGGQPGMQQFQGRQQKPLAPKPPSKKVHPSMDWLKGTTWSAAPPPQFPTRSSPPDFGAASSW